MVRTNNRRLERLESFAVSMPIDRGAVNLMRLAPDELAEFNGYASRVNDCVSRGWSLEECIPHAFTPVECERIAALLEKAN